MREVITMMPAATSARDRAPLRAPDYYRRTAVRERIRQYCGGGGLRPLTCERLTALRPDQDRPSWDSACSYPADALDDLMAAGADIARSLWDTQHLLFHLDLDYHNVDRPSEPFTHPVETFFKLEPVYRAARHVLGRFGINPLVLMTGRGYHFTGRIPLDDLVIDRLAALAPGTPAWHATFQTRQPGAAPRELDERQARAYVGIGIVVEHLSHLIMRQAARRAPIPVVFNGTDVGLGGYGRECISLDFSYAGDPLDTRYIRVAFGTYQLHAFRPDIFGTTAADLPAMVAVPRATSTVAFARLVTEARVPACAARLATRTDTRLPLVTDGVATLLTDYLGSPLATFHEQFYAVKPHPPEKWADTYDRLDTRELPPCVTWPLRQPNDLLLQPARLQHLTRGLLAHGWHPRHIAGLVHSRYAQNHDWGSRWLRMDPQTRAEFDVRVFAGTIATGLDRGVDYNCVSAQEKGLCPWAADCRHDLRDDRPRVFQESAS
jgi:hypothetical protein